MVAALAPALSARDPALAGHAARVTDLAARLAAWLDWDDANLYSIYLGGPLHDIGKVAVSEAILRKPGPLDERELAEIRTHPTAGAKLIGQVGPAGEALPLILDHHERWDGRGYPTGLRGPDIPEGARILAVADAFDAMTSTRPYRRALPVERALGEIERCGGTQFDPAMAHAFLEAWEAGALEPPTAWTRPRASRASG
jgi:HD-GYP domain-containing protein (c-di-GMP phosphodiesterase class II)